ncbi:thioredoxin, partial [Genlisea aurea]
CASKSCSGRNGEDSSRELAGGRVILVTTTEQWEKHTSEAAKDGKTVVVNFSASWCGPCRLISSAYRELAERYPSLVFITVDVDELVEFSTKWDVKATPTFFFLRDGRQVDKLVGANKAELHRKVAGVA